MQIKNNIHLKRYLLGSTINLLLFSLMFELLEFLTVLYFFFGIFLNQYLLIIIVADITGIGKNKTFLPTYLLTILKLLVLLGIMAYAMTNTSKKEHFLVGIYIFQLIILAISTKRIVKKNKD